MTSPQAHEHPHDTGRDAADDGGPRLPNIPLLEDELDHGDVEERKPSWRGWIHAGTFPLAIAAGIVLIALAEGAPAKWSAAVFMATSLLLFGISAVYHRFNWSAKVKAIFRRIDHSNIFLLIAGTYTPFTLGVLRGAWGWSLFGVVWGLAVLGVVLKSIGGIRYPRLSTALYVGMGWLALVAIRPLWQHVPAAGWLWLLAGGAAYTAGIAFYAAERVRYGHFVWHLFVLVGTICHGVAVWRYA
jgi:hemolysin III